MRLTKWIFLAYLFLVALMGIGILTLFQFVPPRDPDTLYSAYSSNIKTLDPASISDTSSSDVAGGIFECLYNYDYEARPYQLIPELAADLPQVSEDGKTVTIPLKKGIYFYDPEKKVFPQGQGTQIKAADLIYSWKRVCNFHQASPNYSQIFEGKIVGLEDWRKYTREAPEDKIDWDRPIEGLFALDEYTIRILLTEPYPQLRYNLAHLPTAAVSRQAVEYWGKNIRHHPIGSGAYFLREHLPEQRIVFEANPIYRGRPDIDGLTVLSPQQKLPKIKRAQWDYYDQSLTIWALFQQGLMDAGGIPKDTFAQAIDVRTRSLTPDMEKKGIRLTKEPSPLIWYYGFNMEDPIFGKNKPLRQAMSMAFDRREYIDLFANGRGEPAIGPIPPGFPIYDPRLINPYTIFNLDAARAKMKEAVDINGGPIPEITFLLPGTDTEFRQMGEFMQKQMAQIGLKIKVDYTNWSRFQEMIDNRQAQFYALGWQPDYPDEQTFLQLFWSKNVSPGPNGANYRNREYDRLYERAVVLEPGPERDELYRKMQTIVMEDCPWLLTYYPIRYGLRYEWVKNVRYNDYAHGLRMYVELDTQLRARRLAQH